MVEMPSLSLAGRTVLITGASSGLGEHLSRLAAKAGGRVALAARRTDRLEAICAEIAAEGGEAMAVALDVADEASTIACYDAIEARFGPVDSVLANAGMNSESPALDLDMDEFDRLMAVNVRGVFLTVREAARRMIAADSKTREHGRIAITSSITAYHISPGLAPYSASKAAVLQMGKVLARDWARKGISLNMILPGYIPTDINREWFETEHGKRQIAGWPRKRLMQETDLDALTLFVLSDAARGVTGAAFTIDDGQTL